MSAPCGHCSYLVSRAGVKMSNRRLYQQSVSITDHWNAPMFAPAPAPLALKARLTRARGWGASGARRTLRNVRPAKILIGSKDRYELPKEEFC